MIYRSAGAASCCLGMEKPRAGFGSSVIASLWAVSVPTADAGVELPGVSAKAGVR
jgi:hypothetical protein